jgi:glycosyltransferase involved in cell wall biosynthesis
MNENKKFKKPEYSYTDYSIIIPYYLSNNLRIFIIEGLIHNYDILKYFKKDDYIFIILPCYFREEDFVHNMRYLYQENKDLTYKNIIFMCPSNIEVDICNKIGLSSILCNHNAFLNENIFKIYQQNKIYNAVMNCRPERWKRPYLAEKINNLAILKGYNFRKNDYYDLNQLNPSYINNDKRLSPSEVTNIYSNSYVGLIFSEQEGACYSSSEYLLCGLPVISTKSKGGRDFWYNEKNSIICEDNSDLVLNCVNDAIEKIKNGYFKSEEIRTKHLEQMQYCRNNLIDKVKELFKIYNISEDSEKLFQYNFNKYEKLRQVLKIDKAINLIVNNIIP